MTALTQLIGKGFEVGTDGDKILISPAKNLTDDIRQWIRDHRSELLAELQRPKNAAPCLASAGCQSVGVFG